MSASDDHQPLGEALAGAQRGLPGAVAFFHCCDVAQQLAARDAPPLSLIDRIKAEYLLQRVFPGVGAASTDAGDVIPPFGPALLSLFEQRGAGDDAAELHSRVERHWLATLLCSTDDVLDAVWASRSAQEVAEALVPRASAGDVDGATLTRLAILRAAWTPRLPSHELMTAPPGTFGQPGRPAFGGVCTSNGDGGTRVAALPLPDSSSSGLCGGDVLAGLSLTAMRRLSESLTASGAVRTAPDSWLNALPAAPGPGSYASSATVAMRQAPASSVVTAVCGIAATSEVSEWSNWPKGVLPSDDSLHSPLAGVASAEEGAATQRAGALLDRAMVAALPTEAAAELVSLLRAAPGRLMLSNLSPLAFPGLVEHSPSIAALCVRCLAAMAPPALVARYWCALVQTDVTLHSMEVVSRLAGDEAESGRASAVASAAHSIAAASTLTDAPAASQHRSSVAAGPHSAPQHLAPAAHAILPSEFIAFYISHCIAACDSAGGNVYAQNRLVRLVAVFLGALLRHRIVGPDSLSLAEVLAFGLRYSRIRECADMYKAATKVDDGAGAGTGPAEQLPQLGMQSQR